MPASVSPFARQIKAADVGILVEIAQDVGKLERAPEMMCESNSALAVEAEHSHWTIVPTALATRSQ
jgi:hypothetical protein